MPNHPTEQDQGSSAESVDLWQRIELRLQGDEDRALQELESLTFEGVDYQLAYGSAFLCHSPERFLKAELLLEQGRFEEALPILDSFGETSTYDEAFVVPAHFLKARAYEKLGRSEEATRQFQRVVDLWQECQPPVCSWVEEAKASISRLSNAGPQPAME